MKNLFFIFVLLFICFLFSSCIFNLDKPLSVEKIEYIDETHFKIYCTGYGESGGLPANEYIIISDEYSSRAQLTHEVVDVEQIYTLFFSVGVEAECEVSPPFKSGEKVVVWLNTPFEETYGYAEFTVP